MRVWRGDACLPYYCLHLVSWGQLDAWPACLLYLLPRLTINTPRTVLLSGVVIKGDVTIEAEGAEPVLLPEGTYGTGVHKLGGAAVLTA